MVGDFLYSQEVTAEDLNNVAIDLGKADFSEFTEGEPYSVDKLNDITASLVSAGVLFIGDRCKVSLVDNDIFVSGGVCVFGNGAKIRISDAGEKLALIEGGTNYVYVYYDRSNANIVTLINSLAAPAESESCILLAEISTAGKITDKRVYSTYKMDFPEAICKVVKVDDCKFYYAATPVEEEINVGFSKFQFVLIYVKSRTYGSENINPFSSKARADVAVYLPDGASTRIEKNTFYDEYDTIDIRRQGESVFYVAENHDSGRYTDPDWVYRDVVFVFV